MSTPHRRRFAHVRPGPDRPGRVTLRRSLTTLLLALAIGLVTAGSAYADTVFSDGFESGDFSAWSQAQFGGDGKGVVQSAIVRTGTLAAQLSETATSGSRSDQIGRAHV